MSLIDFLYHECKSSGGDGDAFWYSRFYDIEDIEVLVEEYNSKLPRPWKILYSKEKGRIDWGNDQEWINITNDEELYKTVENWIQAIIRY